MKLSNRAAPLDRRMGMAIVVGAVIMGVGPVGAADNGGGPVRNCADYEDDCEYLACLCLQEYGNDVANYWQSECMDIDGARICECFCDFGAGGTTTCIGGWGEISRDRYSCEDVNYSSAGGGDNVATFEIAPHGAPCADAWCRMGRVHGYQTIDLQTIDFQIIESEVVVPVQAGTDDDVFTAVIDESVVISDPNLFTAIAENPELYDFYVPGADESPEADAMDAVRRDCETDHDHDGVPDGSFASSPDGTWACCRPDYGCLVCYADDPDCQVSCTSRQCEADHLQRGDDVPAEDDVARLLEENGVAPAVGAANDADVLEQEMEEEEPEPVTRTPRQRNRRQVSTLRRSR